MSKTVENELPFSKRQYPFYRKGMGIEEWRIESKYMSDHLEDVRQGKYKPLWKQKENEH